ncbi:MAG: hypothetical protein DRG50_04030 [Deltaproteobacteria bacterium]|nr:MAG: hypothetical protein DRG50_04030 [Deltaproteobacteria bacterium]
MVILYYNLITCWFLRGYFGVGEKLIFGIKNAERERFCFILLGSLTLYGRWGFSSEHWEAKD